MNKKINEESLSEIGNAVLTLLYEGRTLCLFSLIDILQRETVTAGKYLALADATSLLQSFT